MTNMYKLSLVDKAAAPGDVIGALVVAESADAALALDIGTTASMVAKECGAAPPGCTTPSVIRVIRAGKHPTPA